MMDDGTLLPNIIKGDVEFSNCACANFTQLLLTISTNRRYKYFFFKKASWFPGDKTKLNPFACLQLQKITTFKVDVRLH